MNHSSYIIHILYTGCAKIKKNNSGAKRLMNHGSCIIHILYTGCAKIKKIIPAPNV